MTSLRARRYNARMMSDWSRFDSILVWLPNHAGDAIMATPALRALRCAWPGVRWVAVARPAGADLLAGGPWAENLIVDRSANRPRLAALARLRRQIAASGARAGILFPNSFRSAALARLGGVKPLAGYRRDGRGWLLSVALAPQRDDRGRRRPVPTIDYYLALAEALGAQPRGRQMELPVSEADEAQARQRLSQAGLDDGRPLVMLNPGAAYGPSKLWPAERYAAVADELIRRHRAGIVINAAPNERDIANAVEAAMTETPGLNLAAGGNSLGLVKALARRCRLVITNDTGARHVAAAVGTAVVTLFGSTDPVWAQIDYPRERRLRHDVPCGPCQKKQCPLPPGPDHHLCMKRIAVDEVLEASEALLTTAADPQEAGR